MRSTQAYRVHRSDCTNHFCVDPRARVASWVLLAPGLLVLSSLLSPLALAGEPAPFLSYDFDDGELTGWYNPTGMQAINLCGDVGPAGPATPDSGEVLLTNDPLFGVTLLMLHPDTVQSNVPSDSRDYSVRVMVNLETVNELAVIVRTRLKLNEALKQIDAQDERLYIVALFPQGINADLIDGAMAIGEFTACHELVEHLEWPGAQRLEDLQGAALVEPGFAIEQGAWYWVDVTVQGDDNGGPVLIAARVWPEDGEPPQVPQLTVVDPDGLPHTDQTLLPNHDCEVGIATSLDVDQQPGATARIDNLSVTELQGCKEPPLKATRALWAPSTLAEGRETSLYVANETHGVTIAFSDLRPSGACAAPTAFRLVEIVPEGWTISDVSNGGAAEDNVIIWDLTVAPELTQVSYKVSAEPGGLVYFQGSLTETEGGYVFLTEGDTAAANEDTLVPVSDFGSIQHWLVLGPFTRQVAGAAPGEAQIRRDYLTDGAVTERDIVPKAGGTIIPDYGKTAASKSLSPNNLGRNPGDVPTWIDWKDFDDDNDRIDFEGVYGAQDEVMCYAVTYLNALDDTVVYFGVSSDDSIQVLLDSQEIHIINQGRTALNRLYIDTPSTYPKLGNIELSAGWHMLMVKVFEGGGEHNFRVGFLDDLGIEIAGGPPDIEVTNVPPEDTAPEFRRGDADGDGILNITDGIFTLNFLFSGGRAPPCPDSADADDDGTLLITDPIRVLNFLFLGGAAPPDPGIVCGKDPTDADTLAECEYTECGG